MEKMQYLNSGLRKNKKAVVFSIDAAASIAIAFVLIALAYHNLAPLDSFSQTAMTRFGGDTVNVLDAKGVLDTMNETLFEEEIESVLPPNYDMKMSIECEHDSAEAGNPVPEGEEVGSGEIYFVKSSTSVDDYCKLRYWIWQK
jgi:hypothetical protein